MIARTVVVLAALWPAAAAAAVISDIEHGPSVWTVALRASASHVCHQRPERSFHTAGVAWPVCARCAGLYLGGAGGAWLGLTAWTALERARLRRTLAVAAAATAATWFAEWLLAVPVANSVRFAAALPLGAAIAAAIVRVASGRPESIR